MLKTLNNKFLIIPLLATALIGGGIAGVVGVASADSTVAGKPAFMGGIVTAISQKFGLKETEVQAVFTEQMTKNRAEMEAKMTQDFASRLSTAVSAGKLTQAQADLITAKHAEVKAQLEALKPALGVAPTDADREKIKTLMNSVKTWAESNNIPKEYLMFGKGFGHRGGMGKMMK